MLPMSLDWIFLIALWFSLPVPNVTYVPGLNILDCPLVLSTSAQCYLCPWIEYSWLLFGSLYQCPMLPMSLDWIFLIALWFSLPVPNVTYFPGLNIPDCPLVLYTSARCYLCPWIEHSWLPFGSLYQCPMLPMSLDWTFLISLWFSLPVPNVTFVPVLNILDCPLVLSTSAQYYLCPWIEYSWLLFGSLYQCPMLPMSLDWIFLIALWFSLPVPSVTYVPGLNILDCPLVLSTSAQCYLCPGLNILDCLWFSLPVPNVTYVPRLNILDCPLVLSTSAQCYLCPCIEHSWLPFGSLYQCPILPMSLDWIFLIALWFSLPVPNVTYVPGLNILDCPLVLSTSAQCYLCPWIEYSRLPLGSLYQCPMLPMSLYWTFLIALWFPLPVPNITYVPGLNILDCSLVLSTSAQCYLCPWIEHSWLPFGSLYQCPMLPMSLDWIFVIALWFSIPVPNVIYVPGLNILDCPLVLSTSAQCYLCPWIEHSWLPFGSLYQCPMLPMSLDWTFLIALWFSTSAQCYLCPWIEYSWLPFGSLYQFPMLPMSLDWTFLIALWFSLPVPNVTYVPGLNILDCPLVLSTSAQCYLCPWIEYSWLPFGSLYQCPMLPMSLDWIFLIALWFSLPVPNVTYVPGLNILDCPLVLSTSAQCYLCPLIEYSWLPFGSLYQCPMLPMSLDWIFLIALWFSLPVPNVTYVPGLNILDCPLVLSTSVQCYLCPWIEYSWLPFGSLYQCPMLSMSLDWTFLIALWFSLPVPNATYVPGLNILDCPLVLSTSAQCYLCPCIEHSWLPFGSLPVPNVTYVPGLNILDCPLVLSTSSQCYLCP